ncbi:MAG: DUF5011 domain-containing protein, partial [Nitrosopumilus sp.]|nr:DUF5011 domain-containing protein [Nitrosopumilus sp.]
MEDPDVPSADEVVRAKFDPGFYEKLQSVMSGSPQGGPGERYYGVIIVASRHDGDGGDPDDVAERSKKAVVERLEGMGALDIVPATELSFVTARVPVHMVPELSLMGEVYQLGDGELELDLDPLLNRGKSVVHGTPRDLRDAYGMAGLDGSGVLVATLENMYHPRAFGDRITKHISCVDRGCYNDRSSLTARSSYNEHGAIVAQVLGASKPARSNGIAPGASFINIVGIGAQASHMHAIDRLVREGVDVINMSFGNPSGCGTNTSSFIRNEAVDRGIVVVTSAGNYGISNDMLAYNSIGNPACLRNLISVGGIDTMDPTGHKHWIFSSRGPTGPYVILKPEIVAPATQSGLLDSRDGLSTLARRAGTSGSSPLVAGTAAILLQADPSLTPVEVRGALLLGATWTGPDQCNSAGYEAVDPDSGCSHARQVRDKNLLSDAETMRVLNNMGLGILNASASVKYVLGEGHVVAGQIDDSSATRTYTFAVGEAGERVKLIMTWLVNSQNPAHARFDTERLYGTPNLDFVTADPGGDRLDPASGTSARQNTEFAVFDAPEAGTYTVTVSGSGLEAANQRGLGFALASTHPLSQQPGSNGLPEGEDRTAVFEPGRPAKVLLAADDPDDDPVSFRVSKDPRLGTLSRVIPSGNASYVLYEQARSNPDQFSAVPYDGMGEGGQFTIRMIPESLPPGATSDGARIRNTNGTDMLEITKERPGPTSTQFPGRDYPVLYVQLSSANVIEPVVEINTGGTTYAIAVPDGHRRIVFADPVVIDSVKISAGGADTGFARRVPADPAPGTYVSVGYLGAAPESEGAPEITLVGPDPHYVAVSSMNYRAVDPGATCTDDAGSESYGSNSSSVPLGAPKTFTVEYTCTDETGYSDSVTRKVIVDGHVPERPDVARGRHIDAGAPLPAATCTDIPGAGVKLNVTLADIGGRAIPGASTGVPGLYVATYECRNADGRAGVPVSRDVAVGLDTGSPLFIDVVQPVRKSCGDEPLPPGVSSYVRGGLSVSLPYDSADRISYVEVQATSTGRSLAIYNFTVEGGQITVLVPPDALGFITGRLLGETFHAYAISSVGSFPQTLVRYVAHPGVGPDEYVGFDHITRRTVLNVGGGTEYEFHNSRLSPLPFFNSANFKSSLVTCHAHTEARATVDDLDPPPVDISGGSPPAITGGPPGDVVHFRAGFPVPGHRLSCSDSGVGVMITPPPGTGVDGDSNGTVTVEYSCTDGTSTAKRKITYLVDGTDPVIAPSGTIDVEVGDAFTPDPVSCRDPYPDPSMYPGAGIRSPRIFITPNSDGPDDVRAALAAKRLDMFTAIISCTDPVGNPGQASLVYRTVDTRVPDPPSISDPDITSVAPEPINYGRVFCDPDDPGTPLSLSNTTTLGGSPHAGPIDPSSPGMYVVSYRCADANQQSAPAMQTVLVRAKSAPSVPISLDGIAPNAHLTDPTTYVHGVACDDDGTDATDRIRLDPTLAEMVADKAKYENKNNTVTLYCPEEDGTTYREGNQTLYITYDTEPPVFATDRELDASPGTIGLLTGDDLADHVSCTDNLDRAPSLTYSDDGLTTEKALSEFDTASESLGSNFVDFVCVDAAGNDATDADDVVDLFYTVNVYEQGKIPASRGNSDGSTPFTGTLYYMQGVDLPESLVLCNVDPSIDVDRTGLDAYDQDADGRYVLDIACEDELGRTSEAFRYVIYVDSDPPDNPTGVEDKTITVDTPFNPAAVRGECETAADDESPVFITNVTLDDNGDPAQIDTSSEATYEIRYRCEDRSGNESGEESQTVTVMEPAPPISLDGIAPNAHLSDPTTYVHGVTCDDDGTDATDRIMLDPTLAEMAANNAEYENRNNTVTLYCPEEDGTTYREGNQTLYITYDTEAPAVSASRTLMHDDDAVPLLIGEDLGDIVTCEDNLDDSPAFEYTTDQFIPDPDYTALSDFPTSAASTGNFLDFLCEDGAGNRHEESGLLPSYQVNVYDPAATLTASRGDSTGSTKHAETLYYMPGTDLPTTLLNCNNNDRDLDIRTTGTEPYDKDVEGRYVLDLRCTDELGRQSDPVRYVVHVDGANPAPLHPDGSATRSYGEAAAADHVRCTDAVDPSPRAVVSSVTGPGGPVGAGSVLAPGSTYSITYVCRDAAGNDSAESSLQVLIVPSGQRPAITQRAPGPVIVPEAEPFTDPGATCSDPQDGASEANSDHDVDIHAPAVYTVTYTCTDSDMNEAEPSTRRVEVFADPGKPVIELVGDDPHRFALGEQFFDPGARCIDNGVFYTRASHTLNRVDIDESVPGEYLNTYTCTDPSGKQAVPVTRRVIYEDVEPPVITLIGTNPHEVYVGSAYEDPGADCVDGLDGKKPATANVTDIDTSAAGTHGVRYYCSDEAGNRAMNVTRVVEVVPRPDTNDPVLRITDFHITAYVGETHEPPATCTDVEDPNPRISVASADLAEIINGRIMRTPVADIDAAGEGRYFVDYKCTDASGRIHAPDDKTVEVTKYPQSVRPVITLTGDLEDTVLRHGVYVEPGSNCIETGDDGISFTNLPVVSDIGDLDTSVLGGQVITYECFGSIHSAAPVSRQVTVVPDTVPPVAELRDPGTISASPGAGYRDTGATCTDNVGVVDESAEIDDSAVDVDAAGDYAVRYTCTDLSGTPTTIERTVSIRDMVPVILVTPWSDAAQRGGTFYDPGATCTDDVDGDLPVTRHVHHKGPRDDLLSTSAVTDGLDAITVPDTLRNLVIYYSCSDSGDRPAAEKSREVSVLQDPPNNRPPRANVEQGFEIDYPVGTEFDHGFFTCWDADQGEFEPSRTGDVDGLVTGRYPVTLVCRDLLVSSLTVSGAVNVVDEIPPVIAPRGDPSVLAPASVSYEDPGGLCTDNYDPEKEALADVSAVNYAVPGTYTVVLSCTDSSMNAAEAYERTVEIRDLTPPEVVLSVESPLLVDVLGTFDEVPPATCDDNIDDDVPAVANATASDIDASALGTFYIRYDCKDSQDLKSNKTLPVHVVDRTPPVLTLVGDRSTRGQVNTVFTDPGASCNDAFDGKLPVRLEVLTRSTFPGSSPVIHSTDDVEANPSFTLPGGSSTTIDLVYTCRDHSGNPSAEELRTVTLRQIFRENLHRPYLDPPHSVANHPLGKPFKYTSVTCRDLDRPNFDPTRHSSTPPFDVNRIGTYNFVIYCNDPPERSLRGSLIVHVRDLTPANVTLIGPQNVTIPAYPVTEEYEDRGGTCKDNVDQTFDAEPNYDLFSLHRAGVQEVRVVCEDTSGNISYEPRWVNVTDQTPPEVVLTGGETFVVSQGSIYMNPGAVCDDNVDPDKPAAADPTALSTDEVGDYTVTYTCTDEAGFTTSRMQTVSIVPDNDAPDLIGVPDDRNHEATTEYVEPGATCVDDVDPDGPAVVGGQEVDVNARGPYTVTYTCTDAAGNPNSTSRVVTVVDTTPPELTLHGPTFVNAYNEIGADYASPVYKEDGATCIDGLDGELPVGRAGRTLSRWHSDDVADFRLIRVDTDTIRSNIFEGDIVAGHANGIRYFYTCQDKSGNSVGNSPPHTTRHLRYGGYNYPPASTVLELVGGNVTHPHGQPYTDAGAICTSSIDGVHPIIADQLNRAGPNQRPDPIELDTSVVKVNRLTYTCVDSVGNRAAPIFRIVNVTDQARPSIDLVAPAALVHPHGTPYVEEAVCTDAADADPRFDHNATGVDTDRVGTYRVKYDCTDAGGNTDGPLYRTVTVTDQKAPEFDQLDTNPKRVIVGKEFTHLGVNCVDAVDGTFPATADMPLTQTPTETGTISIFFECIDRAGNRESGTLTVNVVESSDPPMVQLRGIDPQQHQRGDAYREDGAICADDVDEGRPEAAVIFNNVSDTGDYGVYTVTYRCTDSEKQNSTLSRTVRYEDNRPPVLTLVPGGVQVPFGSPFVERGATCTDLTDGDLPVSRTGVLRLSRLSESAHPGSATDVVAAGQSIDFSDVAEARLTLTYHCQDRTPGGPMDATAQRFVSRVDPDADTDPPEIIYSGGATVSIGQEDPFQEPTCRDDVDPSPVLMPTATRGGKPGNYANFTERVPGTYVVTYGCADSATPPNRAEPLVLTVTVLDTTPPVITVNPPARVEHAHGTPYADLGATCRDEEEDRGLPVMDNSSMIDVGTVGVQRVEYTCRDASDNIADPKLRFVNVTDQAKPDVTLLSHDGRDPALLLVANGSVPIDAGAACTDAVDGQFAATSNITMLDTDILGDYTVTYTCRDEAGNSESDDRIVRVIHDKEPPAIDYMEDGYGTGEPVVLGVGDRLPILLPTCADNVDRTGPAYLVSDDSEPGVPGVYHIIHRCSDNQDNHRDYVLQVRVDDGMAPDLFLEGSDPRLGAARGSGGVDREEGATCTDNTDGILNVSRAVAGAPASPLNTDVVEAGQLLEFGSTASVTFTYSCTDLSMQTTTLTRTTSIGQDTAPPVPTPNVPSPLMLEQHEEYVEMGATCVDDRSAAPGTTVKSNNVNVDVPGTYAVVYTCTDDSGLAGEGTLAVVVGDGEKPLITLNPPDKVTHAHNTTYVDLGATCYDMEEMAEIDPVDDSHLIDANMIGVQQVTYTCMDMSGNMADPVTRTVNVTDQAAPEVELLAPQGRDADPVLVANGTVFEDPGATCKDLVDGTFAATPSTTGLDTRIPRDATVTYTCTDEADNTSSKDRTVRIIHDREAPVASFRDGDVHSVPDDGSYADRGAICTDNIDPPREAHFVSSTVDPNRAGTYTVVYSCEDMQENSDEYEQTVRVDDGMAPELVLDGADPRLGIITSGGTGVDREDGATCTDNTDGLLPVSRSGGGAAVDTDEITGGELMRFPDVSRRTLTYSCTDLSGQSDTETRDTVFGQDTAPPRVVPNRESPLLLDQGEEYVELGAACVDDRSAPPAADVLDTIDDTSLPANHTIRYTCTDDAGLTGKGDLTVRVLDTTRPVLSVAPPDPLEHPHGEPYADPGATCRDREEMREITPSDNSTMIDIYRVGEQTVQYECADKSMNTATATRTVSVVDKRAPDIYINGTNPRTALVGSVHTDPGATCVDAVDGRFPATPLAAVDTAAPGTRTLPYECVDEAGRRSTATATINVVAESAPPSIMIRGDNPQLLGLGSAYQEYGATCTDDVLGTYDAQIISSGVDPTSYGAYEVTYRCADEGTHVDGTRQVRVEDGRPPVLDIGSTTARVPLGEPFREPGVTCTDLTDGDLPVSRSGSERQGRFGETPLPAASTGAAAAGQSFQMTDNTDVVLTLTYSCTDRSDPPRTVTAQRTVFKVDEPVIRGPDPPAHIRVGDPDPVTCSKGGLDLSSTLRRTPAFDSSSEGPLEVEYTCGLAPDAVTRTVSYVVDGASPVMELRGDNPHYIMGSVGLTYAAADAGATCTDAAPGLVSRNYSDAGDHAIWRDGPFTVTYTCTDEAGWTSTITRSVVVDTVPPSPPAVGTLTLLVDGGSYDPASAGHACSAGGGSPLRSSAPEITIRFMDREVSAVPTRTASQNQYVVEYECFDLAGNSASSFQRVDVASPAAPRLVGEPRNAHLSDPAEYEHGLRCIEGGIDVSDRIRLDPPLSDLPRNVNSTVVITCPDAEDMVPAAASRTVHIAHDAEPPMISVLRTDVGAGADPSSIYACTDNLGRPPVLETYEPGTDPPRGRMPISSLDTATEGERDVALLCTDGAGLNSTRTARLAVFDDMDRPVLELGTRGDGTAQADVIHLVPGTTYEPALRCTDDVDAPGLPWSIVPEPSYAAARPGTEMVAYTCVDYFGKASDGVTITYVVDGKRPDLAIDGDDPHYLRPVPGATYEDADPGTTCTDDPPGMVSYNRSDAGAFDISSDGAFDVSYECADLAGNTADGSRSVVVDGTPPSAPRAPADADIYPGVGYDPAAQGVSCEQDSGSPVEAAAAVAVLDGAGDVIRGITERTPPGAYRINYTCPDQLGNVEPAAVQRVTVLEPTGPVPVISLGTKSAYLAPGSSHAPDLSCTIGGEPANGRIRSNDTSVSDISGGAQSVTAPAADGEYPVRYTCWSETGQRSADEPVLLVISDGTGPAIRILRQHGPNPAIFTGEGLGAAVACVDRFDPDPRAEFRFTDDGGPYFAFDQIDSTAPSFGAELVDILCTDSLGNDNAGPSGPQSVELVVFDSTLLPRLERDPAPEVFLMPGAAHDPPACVHGDAQLSATRDPPGAFSSTVRGEHLVDYTCSDFARTSDPAAVRYVVDGEDPLPPSGVRDHGITAGTPFSATAARDGIECPPDAAGPPATAPIRLLNVTLDPDGNPVDAVDTSLTATYMISYYCRDEAGNESGRVAQAVSIGDGTAASRPVLELRESEIYLMPGRTHEPDMSCTLDGEDISSLIESNDTSISRIVDGVQNVTAPQEERRYGVMYSCESGGLLARSTPVLGVFSDGTGPEIRTNASQPVFGGNPIVPAGTPVSKIFSCVDRLDPETTMEVDGGTEGYAPGRVGASEFETAVPGIYSVVIHCADRLGNPGTSPPLSFTVGEPVRPTLVIGETEPVHLMPGSWYVPDLTCTDDGEIVDGFLTYTSMDGVGRQTLPDGRQNVTLPDTEGRFPVEFTCVKDGRPSLPRTLVIISDGTRPVITGVTSDPVPLEIEADYEEPVPGCTDEPPGEIVDDTVTNTGDRVDTGTEDTYVEVYEGCLDKAGNAALQVSRRVTVGMPAATALVGTAPDAYTGSPSGYEHGLTCEEDGDILDDDRILFNPPLVELVRNANNTVTIYCPDAQGKTSAASNQTIHIVYDTERPVVSSDRVINAGAILGLFVGEDLADHISCTDNLDKSPVFDYTNEFSEPFTYRALSSIDTSSVSRNENFPNFRCMDKAGNEAVDGDGVRPSYTVNVYDRSVTPSISIADDGDGNPLSTTL